MREVTCSTPSRICLFGEHLDYLGLEVVAAAIDLRFSAKVRPRADGVVNLYIRDQKNNGLNNQHTEKAYNYYEFRSDGTIPYTRPRDYLKSVFNVLMRHGCDLSCGFDIKMDSDIPIGKGMCSSSTMVVVLVKALLEAIGNPLAADAAMVARLGFLAEVAEFKEPGGMMDHYTSALGGLVHLDFGGETKAQSLDVKIPGCFVLFDTLQIKDTTKVLADSKIPVLEAVDSLKQYGITSVRDFLEGGNAQYFDKLDDFHALKLRTAIENYRILKQAMTMLTSGNAVDPEALGAMIRAHHNHLRDGLGISTPTMEKIFDIAYANGALGGKLNGSGGGGCLYVYAHEKDAGNIKAAVEAVGYPGRVLKMDSGVRVDDRISL